MMTPASVRIAVKNPRTYELSSGFPSADGDESVELYVPAYVHQSHCIRMLRDSYWKHQGSGPIRSPAEIAQEHVHVEHCYDYLRQATLCLGDTTLEGPAYREDGTTSNTDGMGIKHQCRDMDFVRAQFRALGASGSD
ncbi:uncharacterized protein LTHEOB_9968 [Lasiodiplodia theobromae]|uniref:uncharacterized protein n=1 Tax=Lasiodiplodia theobromae TaxID=45133 RepID=UPI0015C325B0|nr:uncharacterized protein LTHEOB_9968 [Lasiodiplodia theobromae]KAF4539579.1 hypothetical protein LTHEOB_9968 [Lasiodiplodia theobromae]